MNPQPPAIYPAASRTTWLWLAAILILAAALRLPQLGRRGYLLDEAWTSELATGRGAVHQHLPMGVVLPPPQLFSLHGAPPWWHVWTAMETTHPPLYYVLLRLWMTVFGQGDGTERLLSVLFSLAAIALLFDAARLLNGETVAIWACLLMALAAPQIEHARQNRNYGLELATAVATADVLIRIEKWGANRRRIFALSLTTLAALLTHYFCVGFLTALGIYALLRLRGKARLAATTAFVIALLAFAACWGPFMWQQRGLFPLANPLNHFLQENDPAHAIRSLHRALLMPFEMLAQPPGLPASSDTGEPISASTTGNAIAKLAVCLAVLYLLPLLLRQRRDLLLWWLCLAGAVGLPLGMDLARNTRELAFIRYALLAGPPVYVLIAACAAAATSKWVRHGVPALAVMIALASIAQAYPTTVTDPHRVVDDVQPLIQPDDFLIFIATGDLRWEAGGHFLVLSRYLRPMPRLMAMEDDVATPTVLRQALLSPRTLVSTQTEDPRLFLPGMIPIWFREYFGRGQMWVMQPPTTSPSAVH